MGIENKLSLTKEALPDPYTVSSIRPEQKQNRFLTPKTERGNLLFMSLPNA